MTYFNTTHALGKELSEYREKAKCQEETILRFMLRHHRTNWTASDIWRECFRQQLRPVPLTSVRRAITNLYNAGDIFKTQDQKEGIYGRPEYFWKISTKHLQGDLFS